MNKVLQKYGAFLKESDTDKETAWILPLETLAKAGDFPDTLSIEAVARLWSNNEPFMLHSLETSMRIAAVQGELVTDVADRSIPDPFVTDGRILASKVHVKRAALREWLQQLGEWPLPPTCLLANWFGRTRTSTTREDPLHEALTQAHAALKRRQGRNPSCKEIIRYLESIVGPDGPVVEVTGEAVSWIDSRGKIQDTKFKSIESRLTLIRKGG